MDSLSTRHAAHLASAREEGRGLVSRRGLCGSMRSPPPISSPLFSSTAGGLQARHDDRVERRRAQGALLVCVRAPPTTDARTNLQIAQTQHTTPQHPPPPPRSKVLHDTPEFKGAIFKGDIRGVKCIPPVRDACCLIESKVKGGRRFSRAKQKGNNTCSPHPAPLPSYPSLFYPHRRLWSSSAASRASTLAPWASAEDSTAR